MSKLRLLLIAIALVLPLSAAACRQDRARERPTMTPKPFSLWTQDFGVTAIPQLSVNGTNNWYIPANLTNLNMDKALWVRDISGLGENKFVTGGGRVYYYGSRGYIGAMDEVTGQTIWEKTPRLDSGEEESYIPTNIALTKYSVVILARRGTTHRELDFFDAESGELKRIENLRFDPRNLVSADGKVFAVGDSGEVEAYAEDSGENVASARQVTQLLDVVATPGRLVLLGQEGAAFSLGTDDLSPVAVRLFADAVVWPFVADGKLLLFGRDKALAFSLDPQTLTTVASRTLDVRANLLPAGNGSRVYLGQADGRLRCYDMGAGKYVWTQDLEASCYVFTAFANCVLAVADYPSVTEDQQSGQDQSQNKPATRGKPSWFPQGSTQGYCLFVLSAADGSIISKFPGSGYFMPQSVVSNGILVREDPGGTLACYPADIKPLGAVQAGKAK